MSSSSLLHLPPELRNKIYTYVLHTGIYYLTASTTPSVQDILPRYLSLLLTDRQTHTETHILPFTLHAFYLSSLNFLPFVDRLTTEQRSTVASIEVQMCAAER
jgi:hypothetical protein